MHLDHILADIMDKPCVLALTATATRATEVCHIRGIAKLSSFWTDIDHATSEHRH
jgi:hypothetical protein